MTRRLHRDHRGLELCTVFPPKEYLRWCAEAPEGQELQHIWRREPWEVADGKARPLLSNINVGDRVMHGADNWKAHTPQISIVSDKLLSLGRHLPDGENKYIYEVSWRIGGHYHKKAHAELVEFGYWIWIPHFEQLVTLGIDVERAARLVLGQEEKMR